jgi:hypothetical protein
MLLPIHSTAFQKAYFFVYKEITLTNLLYKINYFSTSKIAFLLKNHQGHLFMTRLPLFLLLLFMFTHCGRTENSTITVLKKDVLEETEHIKIDGLQQELTQVFTGDDVYNYIGITSNGVDCIYFPYNGDKFNIEFEVLSGEQKPYLEKLKAFAKSKGIRTSMITYHPRGYYKTKDDRNVLLIEANTSLEKIAKLGQQIESKVFKNDDNTVYDVVP